MKNNNSGINTNISKENVAFNIKLRRSDLIMLFIVLFIVSFLCFIIICIGLSNKTIRNTINKNIKNTIKDLGKITGN